MRRALHNIENIDSVIVSVLKQIDGNMNDPHELYLHLLSNVFSEKIVTHFNIQYEDGVSMPYIPLDNHMKNNTSKISHAPTIICTYKLPTNQCVQNIGMLSIDDIFYSFSGCICYLNGGRGDEVLMKHDMNMQDIRGDIDHYYSIIKIGNDYVKCDGTDIGYISGDKKHNIYMTFYNQI